ncbi:MAG TPA: hypothetical protein DD417_16065 [Elusimicrobia bacterium]|nr:hypothetical protein [Elusimicrobiota bacterium]
MVVQLWAGISFIRSAAPTYDEPVHLTAGYSYWKTGRYRLNIADHPPLAEMLAAVPLLVLDPVLSLSHPDWIQMRRYPFSDFFLYHNRVPPGKLLDSGRIFLFVLLSLLLLPALALWGFRLGGPVAAAGAAGAAVFCPVLVSNLALVTTDGASAVLFFLVLWLLSGERRGAREWAAAGACAGLALASKFNMILLGPIAVGMLLLELGPGRSPGSVPRIPWRGAALFAFCAFAALALAYRFTQLPLFWYGLRDTLARMDSGRASFLLGRHSNTGFALYFPAALAVKTPIPILLLGFGSAAFGLFSWRRKLLWVILPLAAYFASAQLSKVQIGVRHLLPMMPLLALLAGWGASRLWSLGNRWRAFVAVLGVWLAASAFRVHPHYLAYFNEGAGGPAGGYRWLVDSNLDWGQDLKGLGDILKEMGDPPVYLSYFGTADPAAYGIRFVPVVKNWNVPRDGDAVDPAASGRVLFAVSATNLQAQYITDKTVFDWLKPKHPIAVAGHSIFLYDLSADPEGRGHLAGLLALEGHPRAPALSKSLMSLAPPHGRGE